MPALKRKSRLHVDTCNDFSQVRPPEKVVGRTERAIDALMLVSKRLELSMISQVVA